MMEVKSTKNVDQQISSDNSGKASTSEGQLYFDIKPEKIPIIYCNEYNIRLCGLEKLHPFDSGKWGNVIKILKQRKLISDESLVCPKPASNNDLKLAHTNSYLQSLNWSINIARITEVPIAAFMPNFILKKKLLTPFRYQTGGSVLAGKCAVERGWAINVGGGFHHASSTSGGGFCVYADITLALRFVMNHYSHIMKLMIIDLDAHQGNGHEHDFTDAPEVYILDVYNKSIYPKDEKAKGGIQRRVELLPFTEDEEYLRKVSVNVEGALNEFEPQFVLYNAGTDVMRGDHLGLLSISNEGIIKRDEIVFKKCRCRNIPIVMVTSGGYLRTSAMVIADSISNLNLKGLISLS